MKLHIKNFRSIRQLDLELAPITVLYGQNGTGKSSALYAPLTMRNMKGSTAFTGRHVTAAAYSGLSATIRHMLPTVTLGERQRVAERLKVVVRAERRHVAESGERQAGEVIVLDTVTPTALQSLVSRVMYAFASVRLPTRITARPGGAGSRSTAAA